MKQNFLTAYKKTLMSFLFILMIAVFTIAFVFCIVWPLWYVSLNFSNLYSTVCLVLLAIFIVFFTIKRIKKYLVSESENEKSFKIKYLLFKLLRIFVLVLAFSLFVFFTLNYKKKFAFIALFLLFVLWSILFSFSKKLNVEKI